MYVHTHTYVWIYVGTKSSLVQISYTGFRLIRSVPPISVLIINDELQ
jgi:hypothetical protein